MPELKFVVVEVDVASAALCRGRTKAATTYDFHWVDKFLICSVFKFGSINATQTSMQHGRSNVVSKTIACAVRQGY